jgi:hypothetical protein
LRFQEGVEKKVQALTGHFSHRGNYSGRKEVQIAPASLF